VVGLLEPESVSSPCADVTHAGELMPLSLIIVEYDTVAYDAGIAPPIMDLREGKDLIKRGVC
jgi:hypothetical protein